MELTEAYKAEEAIKRYHRASSLKFPQGVCERQEDMSVEVELRKWGQDVDAAADTCSGSTGPQYGGQFRPPAIGHLLIFVLIQIFERRCLTGLLGHSHVSSAEGRNPLLWDRKH